MVYTDLAGLKGLWSPTDYGSGIEYADGVLNLFPSSPDKQLHDTTTQASTGIQIGLWLNGTQESPSLYCFVVTCSVLI